LPAQPTDAEKQAARIPTLRLERLSPSTLIALFAGVPKLVWLEEPHHGVQLGVEHDSQGWFLRLRTPAGTATTTRVAVPFRAGGRRVIHAAELRARLAAATGSGGPVQNGSAAFALELLDVPWRQRFQNEGGVPQVTGTGAFVSQFQVAAMAAEDRVSAAVRVGMP